MTDDTSIFRRLETVIEDRKARRPANSYTTQLLAGGVEAIGGKVLEEAGELVQAARQTNRGREPVAHEAADLIYHLLVMLAHCGVTLEEVEAELARRFGTSGLGEKAARGQG
jgi:phosphoribosyl-ATP pyrophosphohydrolase